MAENLGAALTTPASTDPSQVEFLVEDGDTARDDRDPPRGAGASSATAARSCSSPSTDNLTGALQQGTFILRKNLTPDQLVSALLAPPEVPYVDIALRTGLRLEQITAKLETLTALQMDPPSSTRSSKSPPAELLADYPWLKTILKDAPKGASLEGFLWPATYRVLPDTTPEELVRLMLDKFVVERRDPNGWPSQGARPDLLPGPDARLDRRARGACWTRRSRSSPASTRTGSTPRSGRSGCSSRTRRSSTSTTRSQLAKVPVDQWTTYTFWAPIKGGLTDETCRPTWPATTRTRARACHPGPIDTPTVDLDRCGARTRTPRTATCYFLAKGDGSGTTAFAKTSRSTRRTSRSTSSPRHEPRPDAAAWPVPADFAAAADRPPIAADGPRRTGPPGRLGWHACGRGSRAAGVDAYFGVRREHMRYLTGFTLADGEEKVAGNSGQFVVGGDERRDPGRFALHDPGRPRGARGAARRGLQRPARRAGRS